jgi:hypothetical protein
LPDQRRETRGKTRTYRVAGRGGHDNRGFAGGCPGDLSDTLPSISDDNIDWQSDQIGSHPLPTGPYRRQTIGIRS